MAMLNIQTCNGIINFKNIFLEIIFCMISCPFNHVSILVFAMSLYNVYILLWLCFVFCRGGESACMNYSASVL